MSISEDTRIHSLDWWKMYKYAFDMISIMKRKINRDGVIKCELEKAHMCNVKCQLNQVCMGWKIFTTKVDEIIL